MVNFRAALAATQRVINSFSGLVDNNSVNLFEHEEIDEATKRKYLEEEQQRLALLKVEEKGQFKLFMAKKCIWTYRSNDLRKWMLGMECEPLATILFYQTQLVSHQICDVQM